MNSDRWMERRVCPGCGEEKKLADRGSFKPNYFLVGRRIESAPPVVGLKQCGTCRLVFKTWVPRFDFLATLIDARLGEEDDGWGQVGYERHVERVRSYGTASCNLLDVGGWAGQFLSELPDEFGRKSALDVAKHDRIEEVVTGEFIQARLDGPGPLEPSGGPYDVVTMFDVLEHLHEPRRGWENVAELLTSGGYLFVETGDTESPWPRWLGVDRWDYVVKDVTHHVFWNREALRFYARQFDFEILETSRTRHRTNRKKGLLTVLRNWLQVLVFCGSPRLYRTVAKALGKRSRFPPLPGTADHLFVVLRKQ